MSKFGAAAGSFIRKRLRETSIKDQIIIPQAAPSPPPRPARVMERGQGGVRRRIDPPRRGKR